MQMSLLPAPSRGVESKPRMMLETSAGENHADARVSPDGHWIAYTSNESGRFEIFVRPFPGPGGKISISTQGGESPRWSGNGRELFYRDPLKNQVVAVDIQTVPEFRAGSPRPLFELRSTSANTQLPMNEDWDVTPDGKRFLVITAPDEPETGARLHAVVNWFEELRRLVPAGGQ